jgi:hypothetical protein
MKDIIKGLKIGIGICIPLVVLVFASLAIARPYIEVQQNQLSYQITQLSKDQAYEIKLGGSSQTCVDIENKLGLRRGDVQSMSTDEQGNITINFAKNVLINETQVSTLSTNIGKAVNTITAK